jgi:hypothetical protein
MSPENKSNPNPAPVNGAGAQEGEQGRNLPLPPYVIPPQELKLKKWLEEAKPGDRLDISSLAPPPPPPPGAVELSKETKFYNFRTKYIKEKSTLILKSGGFTFTVNPLKGIRIYKDNKVVRELNECWAALLFSLANKTFTEYGYNTFSAKWQTVSIPAPGVKKLLALVASLIRGKEKELKDPLFVGCISKTP